MCLLGMGSTPRTSTRPPTKGSFKLGLAPYKAKFRGSIVCFTAGNGHISCNTRVVVKHDTGEIEPPNP
jgi:hypothetical protein